MKTIKTLYNLGENFAMGTRFNFMANMKSLYVIDNHLAAFWCWLKLSKNTSYKLIHVDQHYDCCKIFDNTEELLKSIQWDKIKIEGITEVTFNDGDMPRQLLTWDNYICYFHELNPLLFEDAYFFTHGVGDFQYKGRNKRFEFEEIYDLNFLPNSKYLLNLDIDVFFKEDIEEQAYSDIEIIKFGKWLSSNFDNFDQVILCLSPEMCGDWSNSKRIAELILNEIGYKL